MSTSKKIVLLGAKSSDTAQKEFDYILHQAATYYTEKEFDVVIISQSVTLYSEYNPRIKVYTAPLQSEVVEHILRTEKPDALTAQFGGITAFECLGDLVKTSVFQDESIEIFDRNYENTLSLFSPAILHARLEQNGLPNMWHSACNTPSDLKKVASKHAFPFILEYKNTIATITSEEQLEKILSTFSTSVEYLAHEDLTGWKKIELYCLRESSNSVHFPSLIEYVDSIGVHTADSLCVFPVQTLCAEEIARLKEIAEKVLCTFDAIGVCIIQFAIHPKSRQITIVQILPFCSSNVAFASKASGHPIVASAACISLGENLYSYINTHHEPYIAVQMPYFDIKRHTFAQSDLHYTRKSSGSVFAIGTTFEEALQKAVRILYRNSREITDFLGEKERLKDALRYPTPERIFAIAYAFLSDWTVEEVGILTNIDHYFLGRIFYIIQLVKNIKPSHKFTISPQALRTLKQAGFSDAYLALRFEISEDIIRQERIALNIVPQPRILPSYSLFTVAYTPLNYYTYYSLKKPQQSPLIDFCCIGSGPHDADTPSMYDIHCKSIAQESEKQGKKMAIIECDTCSIHPNHLECSAIFIEEISVERIIDVHTFIPSTSFITQISGKYTYALTTLLQKNSLPLQGISAQYVEYTSQKTSIYSLFDSANIIQPSWIESSDNQEIKEFIRKVEYPVIAYDVERMYETAILRNSNEVDFYLKTKASSAKKHTTIVRKFFDNAKIIQCDFIAAYGECITLAVLENIEPSSTHSSDSIAFYPPQSISIETLSNIKRTVRSILQRIHSNGPGSITFGIQSGSLFVLSYKPYQSKNIVFLTKVSACNFFKNTFNALNYTQTSEKQNYNCSFDIEYVGIHAPIHQFPFIKGSDPQLTISERSNGGVISIAQTSKQALLHAMYGIGFTIPQKNILLSIGRLEDKIELLPSIQLLAKHGFTFYCTEHTHDFLVSRNISSVLLHHISQPRTPNAREYIEQKRVDLCIIIPNHAQLNERTDGYIMRRLSIDNSLPLLTSVELTKNIVQMIVSQETLNSTVLALPLNIEK